MDDVPVKKVREFESTLIHYFNNTAVNVLEEIRKAKDLNEDIEDKIKKAVNTFKEGLDYLIKD